jgi:hypothetical protein
MAPETEFGVFVLRLEGEGHPGLEGLVVRLDGSEARRVRHSIIVDVEPDLVAAPHQGLEAVFLVDL